jgi:cellulose biosynthesis protein BcsQ
VVKTFEHVRQNHNDRLQLLGFVVSRFKQRRKYQSSYLQELRQNFGADAFKTVIPDYAPFEQFVNDRIPIVLHSPSSYAARIARRFFDEVEIRTETLRGVRLASGRGSLSERLPTVA